MMMRATGQPRQRRTRGPRRRPGSSTRPTTTRPGSDLGRRPARRAVRMACPRSPPTRPTRPTRRASSARSTTRDGAVPRASEDASRVPMTIEFTGGCQHTQAPPRGRAPARRDGRRSLPTRRRSRARALLRRLGPDLASERAGAVLARSVLSHHRRVPRPRRKGVRRLRLHVPRAVGLAGVARADVRPELRRAGRRGRDDGVRRRVGRRVGQRRAHVLDDDGRCRGRQLDDDAAADDDDDDDGAAADVLVEAAPPRVACRACSSFFGVPAEHDVPVRDVADLPPVPRRHLANPAPVPDGGRVRRPARRVPLAPVVEPLVRELPARLGAPARDARRPRRGRRRRRVALRRARARGQVRERALRRADRRSQRPARAQRLAPRARALSDVPPRGRRPAHGARPAQSAQARAPGY
mmetsp:Transcript_13337/g.53508  ORF Transcript_13337/g.53508 Transcript_13337/m.53508 type:complete len:411 (-) Transcript_13337:270-1502(-)